MPHFVTDCSENILQKAYNNTETTDLFDKGDINRESYGIAFKINYWLDP